jgi:NAD(P)H-dependent flavin oxidoreductase YrpB (nitropropane dioxygenase family)
MVKLSREYESRGETMLIQTRVTELLGIRYPIIQGGLANLAYSRLAGAVSAAGGLGQITAMSLPSPEHLRNEIRAVRNMTNEPFGVNFAIGLYKGFEAYVDVVIEEKVPVVSVTGGNPEPLLKRIEGTGIKTLALVAATRQAQKAESLGVDAVMAVGHEGGGHIGRDDIGTMVLIPRVVDSVSIPVIASGGIGDGRGLMAALALGAEGIEMGTRFIATQECVAHPNYKKALMEANETDTTIIKRTLGMPGRVLKSPAADTIVRREQEGVTADELYPLISGEANKKAILEGEIDQGYAWAGQIIGMIQDVPTVEQLLSGIIRDAKQIQDKWNQHMK